MQGAFAMSANALPQRSSCDRIRIPPSLFFTPVNSQSFTKLHPPPSPDASLKPDYTLSSVHIAISN